MGRHTTINWTDATFNLVWGCVRVSPGCQNCYAETLSHRWGFDVWGADKPRRQMSDSYWKKPFAWNAQAVAEDRRLRVFCSSMADVFEDHPDLEAPRQRLWSTIERTPSLDWLLLTKRPQNIKRFYPQAWSTDEDDGGRMPENVWLLTTAESQELLGRRAPHLMSVPAAFRGLSVEPMLGPVDLYRFQTLNWVICGGESGPGARPMSLAWARDLRDQCDKYGIPFWFKQLGSALAKELGVAGKGEALEDIPEDLRVRELPAQADGLGDDE